ncbi:MAG: RIP metalloprotease RseP [Betaproteobacteria bacterium]
MAALHAIFWFVVTLAIVIPIHEYGHYRVARACGIKVLRFSVGFGRILFRRTVGADRTEFVLSMLPLGGYVKMLDEREGAVDAADRPRAFNNRPLYQRALVVAAGPAANLVLAVVLYAFVQWWGVDMAPPVVGTPPAGSVMADAGLQAGDRIVATAVGANAGDDDWRKVRSSEDVSDAISGALMEREPLQLRVARRGESEPHALQVALDAIDPFQAPTPGSKVLGLNLLAQLGEVAPDGAGAASGLKSDDLVLRVDGKPVTDASALRSTILASAPGGVPRTMTWDVRRAGGDVTLAVTARIVQVDGAPIARLGIGFMHEVMTASPFEAIQLGALQTWRQASSSLRMFGLMLTGRASTKGLGGPGTIAEVASSSAHQGFVPFITFLAMISVGLGVLNLLPIPMLDGGMLLYYLFEGATGRPVSELWQIWLQRGGALILLLLMTLALSNDVVLHLGPQ